MSALRFLRRAWHLLAMGWCAALALPPLWAAAPDAACPPAAQSLLTPRALQAAQRQPQDRGFLWRLERDGRSSWLYGTLHLGRAAWVVPGPQLAAALRASDTLALEIDPLDLEAMKPLFAPGDPVRRAQVLTQERLQRLQRQWQAACAPDGGSAQQRLQPLLQVTVLAAQSAQRDGLYTDFAIDLVLAGYARHARLPLVTLETAQSQLALFTADSAREEAEQIDEALGELESGRLRHRMGELAAMWARSDWPRLQAYEQWCECLDTPSERAQMHRLLDERNPVLAEGIEALHAGGQRVFAAVGALHMVGPQGLPALLAQRGFVLTPVLPAATAAAAAAR
ncbi:TraB/GumN family protein [Xenophilus arseniciresistens]|uniref:TraB/GumN family protein n=1 Tax=Xenophilus arseniciresistens TaxID=1283306 RepID=A0AAE3NAT5_9BURK|nr:TraB/GumN family protein [Xenophilus arseniciresistens]MDA7418930.1 TraB/GumN family protein [Xenophilus arseniciresistens]